MGSEFSRVPVATIPLVSQFHSPSQPTSEASETMENVSFATPEVSPTGSDQVSIPLLHMPTFQSFLSTPTSLLEYQSPDISLFDTG